MDRGVGAMSMTPTTILSREAELAQLSAFLDAPTPSSCLVFVGEPGVGKTSLWEVGLDLARARGYAVLDARGSEAEAGLSFAALGDLVEGIGPDVLSALPPPQLRAIEIALRAVDPEGTPPDPLAISSGCLNALRALAERQRVIVAIDDVQWLDQSSADPILFAVRRLLTTDIRFLLARRPGPESPIETALRSRVAQIELTGLSLGAINRLLSSRLGLVLHRRELLRLHEESAGNPLFAVELGRALLESKSAEVFTDLPVPERLEELFGERLRDLPSGVHQVVLAVALSAGLRREELVKFIDPLALEDAVGSGLVLLEGDRVRPRHPLIAAAARHHSEAAERQHLHLSLASAMTDVTLQARHLALAVHEPDETVAARVAAAAEISLGRGAAQEAEELAAHALRLTPIESERRGERILDLARRHLDLGDMTRAHELLSSRLDALPPGRQRALAHVLLAEAGDVEAEGNELALALAESGEDPEVRAEVSQRTAMHLALSQVEHIDEAEARARDGLRAARAVSEEMVGRVLPALAWVLTMRGRPFDELHEFEQQARPGPNLYGSAVDRPRGVRFAFRGELHEARATFQRLLDEAVQRGEFRMALVVNIQRCEVALRSGEIDTADQILDELDVWTALEELTLAKARFRALIAALRGQPSDARDWANEVLASSQPNLVPRWDELEASRACGLAALFEQDWVLAIDHFVSVWEWTLAQHVDDPGAFPVAADLVEALVRSGDLRRARAIADHLEKAAADQNHPWGLATTMRCRALIVLAERYDACVAEQLRSAAASYERLDLTFDAARSLLALGVAERRWKKNADARRSLDAAAALFQSCGCVGWAELAGAEAARVSGRRRTPEAALTPSEHQVAVMAADGFSNKEIAAKLTVSVNTVEAHLTHSYAKLGVRSRGQLAKLLFAQ